MIIYNVTSSIDPAIHHEWLSWMKQQHIPKILQTGNFYKVRIIKVLVDEAQGGVTYSTQYLAHTMDALQDYYSTHADVIGSEVKELFGDRVLQFETELQVIEEFES